MRSARSSAAFGDAQRKVREREGLQRQRGVDRNQGLVIERIELLLEHRLHELVLHEPGAVVRDPELARERERGNAVFSVSGSFELANTVPTAIEVCRPHALHWNSRRLLTTQWPLCPHSGQTNPCGQCQKNSACSQCSRDPYRTINSRKLMPF